MPHKDPQKRKQCMKAAFKRYKAKNREKFREWDRQYRKRHPQRLKQKKRLMNELIKRDGAKCKKCGSINNLTLEHKIPRVIGGKHNLENLEILCLVCNIKQYHALTKKALVHYFKCQKYQVPVRNIPPDQTT